MAKVSCHTAVADGGDAERARGERGDAGVGIRLIEREGVGTEHGETEGALCGVGENDRVGAVCRGGVKSQGCARREVRGAEHGGDVAIRDGIIDGQGAAVLDGVSSVDIPTREGGCRGDGERGIPGDRGVAGVAVGAREGERAGADFGEGQRASGIDDISAEGAGGIIVANRQNGRTARAVHRAVAAEAVDRLVEAAQGDRAVVGDIPRARAVGNLVGAAQGEGGILANGGVAPVVVCSPRVVQRDVQSLCCGMSHEIETIRAADLAGEGGRAGGGISRERRISKGCRDVSGQGIACGLNAEAGVAGTEPGGRIKDKGVGESVATDGIHQDVDLVGGNRAERDGPSSKRAGCNGTRRTHGRNQAVDSEVSCGCSIHCQCQPAGKGIRAGQCEKRSVAGVGCRDDRDFLAVCPVLDERCDGIAILTSACTGTKRKRRGARAGGAVGNRACGVAIGDREEVGIVAAQVEGATVDDQHPLACKGVGTAIFERAEGERGIAGIGIGAREGDDAAAVDNDGTGGAADVAADCDVAGRGGIGTDGEDFGVEVESAGNGEVACGLLVIEAGGVGEGDACIRADGEVVVGRIVHVDAGIGHRIEGRVAGDRERICRRRVDQHILRVTGGKPDALGGCRCAESGLSAAGKGSVELGADRGRGNDGDPVACGSPIGARGSIP